MTGPELIIVALVYVASLLLSQRAIAIAAPTAQEAGLAIAGVLAVATAAVLYHRRARAGAPLSVKLAVGGVLAITVMMAGMFSQLLWQSLLLPMIALPIAALATALGPLVIFPLVRKVMGENRPSAAPATVDHALIAVIGAVVLIVIAFLLPAQGRSIERLVTQRLPGMRVALPDWPVAESSLLFDNGTIKLDDPHGFSGYMALRWTSGDPVQPHEYVELLTGRQIPVRWRHPVNVSGHDGATFYLESNDGRRRAVVTIWNCTNDRRSMSLFSSRSGSKEIMIADHNKVVSTVRCHRASDRTTTEAVFPQYVPPASFERNPQSSNLLFIGPAGQNIIFEPAVGGRNPLAAGDVPADVVTNMIKQVFAITTLDGEPTMHNVPDMLGHERRVWSAKGATSGGARIQVEVMAWHCDVRDMTFIGGYATNGEHPLQHAIDILLPAACHNP